MKRAYLVAFFCILPSLAVADRYGDFIRIECNQDFGLLEISENVIFGSKIGDYFAQKKSLYEYTIDVNGNDKSHAQIVLLNSLRPEKKPFTYHCQLAENLSYDITINTIGKSKCTDLGYSSYTVRISEYTNEKKVLVDDVQIGCGTSLEKIQLTSRDNNAGSDVTFLSPSGGAYFMYDEISNSLTDEIVIKKIKEQTVYDNSN